MKKMLNELVRYGKFAFALAFALCCFNASAAKKSVEITLNQSLATSEITTGLPALVRLSESSISDFSYTDCTGSNMKFTDAGGNELAYEVDTWNTSGESLVWVKLPSSAANTKITLTYGDGVTPSAPSTDVWSDYVGVWHLNGSVGATHADVTVADSTANGYVATAKGAVAGGYSEGKIGSAWNVYSTEQISSGSYKVGILVNDKTISLGSSYTVSAWVKHYNNSFDYDHLFYRKNASTATTADGGYASEISGSSSTSLDVYGNGATKFQFKNFPDTNQKWAHVALCYDSSSVYPYVNGAVVGTGGTIAPNEGTLAIAFGTDSDNNDKCPWHGDFDELRIRKGSRNDDYLAAEYAAMNTSGTDIFDYGAAVNVGGEPEPITGDYYVSGDGKDTNNGTSREAAFRTIARAVTAVDSASDKTIVVLEGTYEITDTISLNNGTKLIGEGMDKTTIKPASGRSIRCAILEGGAKLEGVTLTGGNVSSTGAGAGVWIKKGTVSWCCISNNLCTVGAVGGAGVSFDGGEGTIDHSIVVGNVMNAGSWGAGIGANGLGGSVLIDTCLIYGNTNNNATAGGIAMRAVDSDCIVRNCTIVGNKANSNVGGVYRGDHGSGKLTLVNNIITGNYCGSSEINAWEQNDGEFDDVNSKNCIITGTSDRDESVRQQIATVSSADPNFVNVAANNYHLGPVSPAKGAGVVGSGSGVDLDNKAFNGTPSIGCYEYDSEKALQTGWTAIKLDDREGNIVTDGTLKYAYTAASSALTVNTVLFKPWGAGPSNEDVSLTPPAGEFSTPQGHDEGVSGYYGTLLGNVYYCNTQGDFVLTLNNLEVGKRYLAQIITHYNNGNPVISVQGTDPLVSVKPCSTSTGDWVYGGTLVGVFEATGSSQTFTLVCSDDSPFTINAVQLRELGDAPTPTGADYYVSTDGSDSNNGRSRTSAFATIAHAVSEASGTGEVICVLPGVYTVEAHDDDSSAAIVIDKAVTICGDTGNPDDVVIRNTAGNEVTRTSGLGAYRVFLINHADAVVSGITVEGGKLGGGDFGGGNIRIGANGGTVTNCIVRNAIAYGYSGTASKTRCSGAGIYAENGLITHCVITNNFLTRNGTCAFGNLHNVGGCAGVHIIGGVLRESLIAYNETTKDNMGAAVYIAGNGTLMENCTVAANRSVGQEGSFYPILFYPNDTEANNPIVRNTLIINGSAAAGTPGLFAEAWLTQYSAVLATAGKRFVNCATDYVVPDSGFDSLITTGITLTRDFRPTTGSSVIDAGTEMSSPVALDLAGNPRVGGTDVDIGCYEYDSATPEPMFFVGALGYTTWADAYAAVSDGGTIKAGANATISGLVGKRITIDLNGWTVETVNGVWMSGEITIVDNGEPAGRIVFLDNGTNINQSHLDLSALDSSQISGKLGLQMSVTEVKFPSDMSYEAALQHISYSTKPDYDPEGTTLVIRDVTYTWDGSAWVAQTTPEGDWFVSPSGDDNNNDGKSADTAFKTIAKAVTQATDGDTICVLAGTYNISATIEVNKGITIKGEGWDKTIVDGTSNAALFRLFKLDAPNAKLEGMKLTGAKANSRGAAVHMTDGTISWCYICENSCTAGSGYWGGAVSILKGTIDHSVITNNTSTISGAAIGSRQGTGDILIDTCLVYGNSMSSEYNGSGGIDLDSMTSGTVKIRNCTIVNNASTGDYPAGVRVTGAGSVVLINDIISGNQRTYNGTTGELNLAVTTEMLDRTNSRNCIITGTKDTDSNYYRDAGAVSQISGSKNVAPTFVGEASGDYHLSSDSSAIAAGVTYTGIGKDLDSKDFVNPPSIGCYEYDGVAPTTYAVTWSGAANATVSAKVDGAAITSGAMVANGKSVVFTVTPNSGYEFATASDGWMISGANLTKTVTVNGAAVSVVIPGATAIPVVATPAFSPAAGTITEATDVTITCATDGATIYYTTNGDDPTSSSTQYTAPIALSATTTIKAIAVKSGYLDSSIASATYTYEPPQPTDPAIGSLVITPNGSTAWFSLSGITLGTDSGAVPATLYSVDFAVKNSAGSTIKNGTKLTGQTSSSCFFDVADIPDGIYTGYVTITTDKGKTATKHAEFTIDTTSEEPTIPLGWTAAPMSADPSSVRTDGNLLYAYAQGACTANGVVFSDMGSSGTLDNGNVSWTSLGSYIAQRSVAGVADAGYAVLLSNSRYSNIKPQVITLKNLTCGHTYLVQIIGCRTDGQSTDAMVWVDETGDSSLYIKTGNFGSDTEWPLGGTLVGVFEADSTSKTITLNYAPTGADWASFNAIQVRDVTPARTLEPGATATETRKTIQDEIDAVAPYHGTVTLGSGTFEIDEQLYVTNGVTLVGQGWENTTLKYVGVADTANSRVAMIKEGAVLSHVTVTGGKLKGGNWTSGGGVQVRGSGTVSWCCVTNNYAKMGHGGGICGWGDKPAGNIKIDHTIVAFNKASEDYGLQGGGIGFHTEASYPFDNIEIDTCLVYSNMVGAVGKTDGRCGGGISFRGGQWNLAVVRNTTITDNMAYGIGGGLYTEGNLALVNNIIAGNEATVIDGSTKFMDIAFNNESKVAPTSANTHNCLFGFESEMIGEGSVFGDPNFVGNGDYHLGDASVAFGSGTSYDGSEGNVDLDNKPFAAPPSIGCYEYAGSGLEPEDTPTETRQMIQDAIDAVAPVHGTVFLGEGTFEIDQQLFVTNGVTLAGKGWEKTILKYVGTKNQATSRVATLGGGATLSHVTVTGGSVATSNAAVGGGVAIEGYDEGATISWCCITNNYNTYGPGSGIGVASAENVRIDHTIVSGNTGYAGICVLGGLNSNTQHKMHVEIDTCLVAGNTAGSNCAGIRIGNKDTTSDSGGDAGVVTAIIRNTTVAGNQVTGTGTAGGVYVSQQKTTLVNCIFSDNTIVSGQDPNVVIADHVKDAVVAMTANCYFGGTTTAFGYAPKSESVDGAIAFVNAANGDYYHLTANSPAIAAGSTIAADRVDLDNVAFVVPPSVGCYEYESNVPAPKFTPASGTKFQTQLEVKINGQGTIYYTTDGTVPTEGSSTYSSARTISDTTKFMARAYVGGVWSAVASATYVKAAPDAGDYYVSITGSDFADGLTPETAFRTIERAVEVANEGQKVTILPGTFEIDETIVIDKAITVTGSGWDATTIQPTSGTKIRLFILDGGAKLEGVTLTGGDVSSDNGAAAWVKDGTISWCRITNNKSNFVSTSGNGGAAVTFDEGQGTIDHCIVANNTGSTYCYGSVGAATQSGPVVVDTCLIYQNDAYNGGGVGFSEVTSMGVTVKNCTIVGNTGSYGYGGGIYFANGGSVGTCKIINTIATGNAAGSNNSDLAASPNATASLLVEKCFFGSEPTANGEVTPVAVTYTIGTADFTDDYHPAAGWEDVIGKGVTYAGIGDTLDGMPFNDPPSIGCYEPSIGFGKVTFAYPAKHVGTATVQLIGLSDGATTANVTFQYGPDSEHLCEPAIVVTNGVGIKTDIVATMSGLNANCEYAYLFKAVDDKGETATREGIFTTDDWDTLQFSTVKANPTSNSADVSVTIMKLGLGATNATVYVQWGTNYNDLCEAIRISTTASQKQTLTYTITGLKNETDYVVRFSGENDVGDTATRDGAFKTLEKEKLALGEPKVSNLGQTTADIAVTVPTLGEGANSATVTLKWWIDGTTDTNSVVMSSAAVRGSSLSQQITGLTANKLYLYEIEAVNDLPSPETETKSVTGGFTTDDPNIGADDYHDSYPTVDANHVVTYDADSAGNPSTLEPGSPYVVVAKEGYGVSHPAGGKTYWFRNEYDYQYNCSARIGDTYYLLLSDAVAAASSGATIELLRNNYAIGVTMQISRKLTIEGNGYAVKVAAPFLDTTGYVNPKCTATPKTVFKIGTGGDVVINDMLVMGGGEQLATGGAGSNSANDPAIVVTDTGILEMDHVTVKRSQGGLWIGAQAKVHLNACNLVKNARFCGGGLYSLGVLVMENSSLSENRSLSSGGGGAAAENQGLLVMNNCVICNNGSTEYGGAINNLKGTAVVYMMNMTMAGNFTSNKSDNGGGIGLHQAPGALYMVNSILCNNYHYDTTSGQGEITDSDIYALTDVGNVNNIYYSVYGVAGGSDVITFHDCWKVVAADEDVFKDYTKFSRTYEQAKTTGVPIPGPLFDYAPSNEDARYAPLTENGSKADVDNEGVYTYFDASAWRSAEGNSDVSWLKMAYREDDDTTLTALGNCAMADEEDLVTTYYETAFDPTISDREPGVVGASGFGTHKKTYTLILLENPVNGGVSDNLDLYGKSYNQGAEVTVVATPDAKCTFLGWFDAKDATEPVSTKLAYKFVMDSNKSLLARFSEPSETVIFYEVKCEQTEGDHDLFQIEITKDWLGKVFPTICPGGEVTTTEVKALVEAELNKPDSANGLNHVWQNYVLGQMSPGDPGGRIWIRGAQYYETDKLTFNIQEFAETKDCGFLVRYRLAKKDITKGETEFNRSGEYKNNTVGKFNDPVSEDIRYCVIDMIFIPTTAGKNNKLKLDTSFEYVTTVNTAGVMKVNSDKRVEILASPFVGFSPTNNPTIKATDYVKASCLNKDDVLYIYDRAHSNYLAWAVQDGQWAQKDTYQIINGVVYKDDDPADIANTNSLPRGMGAWLERSNTKSPIYLYGQVDPSPVTTTLEPGFNLVGNPYPYEFDASQLPAPMEKSGSQYVGDSEDLDDDHIVIPTGGAPLNCEYANGSWGSYVTKVVEIKDAQGNPVINKKTGKPMTGVVTEWSTDGMTLPIGHGFWYYNSNPTSYELVWPKVKSEEAE